MNISHLFRLFLTITIFILVLVYNTAFTEPHWNILNPYPVAGDIVSIDFVDEDVGWLVTDGGLALRTENSGISWSNVDLPNLGSGAKSVDFIDRDRGWILGGVDNDQPWREVIYFTSNGGEEWGLWFLGDQLHSSNLTCLYLSNPERGWVAGTTSEEGITQPAVYRYEGNDRWRREVLPDGEGIRINNIYFIGQNLGWTVGQNGYIATTFNGGLEWQRIENESNLELLSVAFGDPFHGWAVGGNFQTGLILRSTDGGENWQIQDNHQAESRFVSIHALSEIQAVAVSSGWNAEPARVIFTENGERWTTILSDETQKFYSLSVVDNKRWIGGSDGFLINSADGRDWSRLSRNLLPGSVYGIKMLDDQTGWCTGSGGILIATDNGGSDWRSIETGFERTFYTVTFRNRLEGWLTGEWSTELRTTDGGRSWNSVDIGDNDVNLISFDGESGYATHDLSISVTHDGGDHWESTGVIRGNNIPAIQLSVPTPDIAYVASPGDSLRRTLDGGDSWHAVNAPASGCYGVSFVDTNNGLITAPSPRGGVRLYRTGDGGGTWTAGVRFDFVPGGIHFNDNLHGWIWSNPGMLMETDDGGRSWTDMQLEVNRTFRSFQAINNDNLWVCGDGSLIACWREDNVNVGENDKITPSQFMILPPYPNPTNSSAKFTFLTSHRGLYTIRLYNPIGQIFREINTYYEPGRHQIQLSLDALSTGSYFIDVSDGFDKQVERIILIR